DTTASFSITPAAASQLVITSQPASQTAGVTLGSIVAKIEDQYGNVVTTDISDVTITTTQGSGTLSGTTTVTAVAGVATFSDLSVVVSGSYQFNVDNGVVSGNSTSSTVVSPDAAH